MRLFRLTYRQQMACCLILIATSLLILGCTREVASTPIPAATSISLRQFTFSSPAADAEFEANVIISADGTHNLTPDSTAWIFLRDIYSGYYLQSPAIEVHADGTWGATNIRLGKEIQYIIAIYVEPEGDSTIRSWVNTDRWGRIEEDEIKNLSGYYELSRVRIKTPGVQ